jgi:hypothetical protein
MNVVNHEKATRGDRLAINHEPHRLKPKNALESDVRAQTCSVPAHH